MYLEWLIRDRVCHLSDFEGVVVENVWKSYGRGWVLRGISFKLVSGSTLLVVGPNGCGKTTLLKIVAGLLRPTRGTVLVYGSTPTTMEAKRFTGVVLDHPMLYRELTVEENLRLFASLYGVKDYDPYSDEVVEMLGLHRWLKVKVGELSFGWRKRADIARAMIHRPKLLIVDEPLNGLDTAAAKTVSELLYSHVSKSRGIVLAASPTEQPLLDWMECGRIVDGKLVLGR